MEITKEPMCLVDSGVDGKMTVNVDVLNQLKNINKEAVVVTIAGPYRSGKSYLMNKLAGERKGFALGSTVQSKTKGIWVWAKDHPRHKDKCLILLDTEGLGDVEKGDENHDNHILCLAVLLSSTLVYNVKSVIGNDAIQKLHFITELSKHIQVRSNSGGDDANFDFYFPDFVYAIRDFSLDLEIDGREVTADEYLEHSLAMKEGNRKEIKEFNKIRSCIRSYFKKRKCFTFIQPVPGKVRNLDQVTDDQLLPEFREETDAFLNYIFQSSPVKQVGGKKLTGRMLGSLLEVYVEQMKTGMPYVENAVDQMAQLENTHATEEAVAHYYNLMLEMIKMPMLDDTEFSLCHNNSLQKAIDLFLSKAVFDQNQVYQRKMNEDIEQKYKELVKTNENVCVETCRAALEQHYARIRKNVRDGYYTKTGGFRLYKDDLKKFQDDYLKSLGLLASKMRHVLLEFLHERQTEEDAILKADEMVTAAEKEREVEAQRARDMERQKEEAERASALQAQMAADQARAHSENIERLENKMRDEAEAARKHYTELMDHRLAEQQRLLKEGFTTEANQLRARIDELQRQSQQRGGGGGKGCTIL